MDNYTLHARRVDDKTVKVAVQDTAGHEIDARLISVEPAQEVADAINYAIKSLGRYIGGPRGQ